MLARYEPPGSGRTTGDTMRLTNLAVVLVLGVSAFQGQAQGPVILGTDGAGPKPANVLPEILGNLRRSMKDPYSIRDLKICQPKIVPAVRLPNGTEMKPSWTVDFSLNAKNSYGGYSGVTPFTAHFENGKLTDLGSIDINPNINAKMLELSAGCPSVPDATIKKLLDSAN